jgi:hypothetical protein
MAVENSRLAGLVLTVIFVVPLVCLYIWKRVKYTNRKSNVVDPVAEAEVYIAYGRKDRAIEVLEKAHLTNPSRIDITTKLDELRVK